MTQEIGRGVGAFFPELMLVFTIVLLIVMDVFPGKKSAYLGVSLALSGLFLAFLFTLEQYPMAGMRDGRMGIYFSGMLAVDRFSLFFKLMFVVTAVLTVLLSITEREIRKQGESEFLALTLTCVLGMFLFVAANNLLMFYLAIEMVSIPSYILSGFYRGNRRSAEASLKYVVYGAAASGMMIYGFSLLYGMAGTLDLGGIRDALAKGNFDRTAVATTVLLILAGFGYKIAAVPFHMWCPDIYEGAPTPITAFLSVGPKAAGFGALIRFFYLAMSEPDPGGTWHAVGATSWPMVLAIISVATMTLGNLAALMQTNLKRLMAYSSIAHAGYLLMGCCVLSQEGLTAILFYLAIYLVMNMGAFLVVVLVAEKTGSEEMSAFRGLGWKNAYVGVSMAFLLFSLVGLPPTAGFIGKLYLFSALIQQQWYWLALAGMLNSVVSLFYYAKIIRTMFLEGAPEEGAPAETVAFHPGFGLLLGVMAGLILVFGIYWVPLFDLAQSSASLLSR